MDMFDWGLRRDPMSEIEDMWTATGGIKDFVDRACHGITAGNQAQRVEIALTYIHGIGRTMATNICQQVGLPRERRVNELTDDEVHECEAHPELIEFELRGGVALEILLPEDLSMPVYTEAIGLFVPPGLVTL